MSGLVRALRRLAPGSDAAASMFSRIRWRLTAWYTVILAVTLLILGILLYVGERSILLGPVDTALHDAARSPAETWQAFPGGPCPRLVGPDTGLLWACYDSDGQLIRADPLTEAVPLFIAPSAVRDALRDGASTDTFDSHTALGTIRRYAVRVADPQSGSPLGVFEVGAPVGDQIRALNTLLNLLLIGGSLGVVAAAAGGLFLANRSLLPVRLAYLRQRNFIADASHELRTPLTILRADAEVLLRGRDSLTPDQAAILQDMVTETSHMTSLTNSMLDLARLDTDRVHLERDVVDLAAMTRDLARRVSPLASERGVSVRAEADGTVLVLGDSLLLEHAALILADNAIKYNRPGGDVELRVRRVGNRAVLELEDSGIGIAAEHLPRLGERFYRIDKARSREGGGAGLGLSIVRGIVTRHAGSFELLSSPGEGTTARIALPALEFTDASAESGSAAVQK